MYLYIQHMLLYYTLKRRASSRANVFIARLAMKLFLVLFVFQRLQAFWIFIHLVDSVYSTYYCHCLKFLDRVKSSWKFPKLEEEEKE